MEIDLTDLLTVSGNGLEIGNAPLPAEEEEAVLDYTDQLDLSLEYMQQLNEKLDRLIELQELTLSGNELPEDEEEQEQPINVYVTVSQNAVSENTVSANTVSENALMITPLTEYSLEASLQLLILILLFSDIVIQFFFRKGGSKE